uniref:Uncharacterized protein n=1 Tax=Strigamia maritima TaxID=126957 RepID=T1J320_STRMM
AKKSHNKHEVYSPDCCFCTSQGDLSNGFTLHDTLTDSGDALLLQEDPRASLDLPLLQSTEGGRGDGGSLDSSNTYASCNTHSYSSQMDLSALAPGAMESGSNLYVNPLDSPKISCTPEHVLHPNHPLSLMAGARDMNLFDDSDTGFTDSRGSLTHSPSIKQRKSRFSQGSKPRPWFRDHADEEAQNNQSSGESLNMTNVSGRLTKGRPSHRSSFTPAGKSGGSRSSLSGDSGVVGSPDMSAAKKKSILKRSDMGGPYSKEETEKLISSDSPRPHPRVQEISHSGGLAGGLGGVPLSTGVVSDLPLLPLPMMDIAPGSPVPGSPMPGIRGQPRKAIGPKTGTRPQALPIKFVGIGSEDLEKHARDENQSENKTKDQNMGFERKRREMDRLYFEPVDKDSVPERSPRTKEAAFL